MMMGLDAPRSDGSGFPANTLIHALTSAKSLDQAVSEYWKCCTHISDDAGGCQMPIVPSFTEGQSCLSIWD